MKHCAILILLLALTLCAGCCSFADTIDKRWADGEHCVILQGSKKTIELCITKQSWPKGEEKPSDKPFSTLPVAPGTPSETFESYNDPDILYCLLPNAPAPSNPPQINPGDANSLADFISRIGLPGFLCIAMLYIYWKTLTKQTELIKELKGEVSKFCTLVQELLSNRKV
jgi:hypothetical protein